MSLFQKAMRDPSACFKEPKNIVTHHQLSQAEKIKILQQWEQDARQESVAEEENMSSQKEDYTFMLQRIREALRALGAESKDFGSTKQ